jgi:hypothetical protein
MTDLYFNSVQEFNDHYGFETFHPLVSVVRFDRKEPFEECMVHYGVYAITFADTCTSPFFTMRIESLLVLLYVTCIAISICH